MKLAFPRTGPAGRLIRVSCDMSKTASGLAATPRASLDERDDLARSTRPISGQFAMPDAGREPIAALGVHVSASRLAQRIPNRSVRIDSLACFRREG